MCTETAVPRNRSSAFVFGRVNVDDKRAASPPEPPVPDVIHHGQETALIGVQCHPVPLIPDGFLAMQPLCDRVASKRRDHRARYRIGHRPHYPPCAYLMG